MNSGDKQNESIEELVANAVKKVKKDPQAYEVTGKELEELGDHEGPILGPRNDIEYRKLLNEIEESGKDDYK